MLAQSGLSIWKPQSVHASASFLGTLTLLRKATVNFFMYVRWTDFHEILYWWRLQNRRENSKLFFF